MRRGGGRAAAERASDLGFQQRASRIGSGGRRAQESKDGDFWGFVLSVRTGGGRFLRKNINESSLGPCEV